MPLLIPRQFHQQQPIETNLLQLLGRQELLADSNVSQKLSGESCPPGKLFQLCQAELATSATLLVWSALLTSDAHLNIAHFVKPELKTPELPAASLTAHLIITWSRG